MIIGVDVDLTVVDTGKGWFEWLKQQSTNKPDYDESTVYPYNFSGVFDGLEGIDTLDYWRSRDLYNGLRPIEGSVEVLRQLSEDHMIVFVSTLKGDHHKSKYEFVKRSFPFLDGFIGTKEKQFARMDLLIDDRIKNLNNCLRVGVRGILYDTPYTQEVSVRYPYPVISSWDQNVIEIIEGY